MPCLCVGNVHVHHAVGPRARTAEWSQADALSTCGRLRRAHRRDGPPLNQGTTAQGRGSRIDCGWPRGMVHAEPSKAVVVMCRVRPGGWRLALTRGDWPAAGGWCSLLWRPYPPSLFVASAPFSLVGGMNASGSTGQVGLSIIGDSSQAFSPFRAEVAELADAQASGACGRKVVEVQILSSAYLINSTRCRDVCPSIPRRVTPVRRGCLQQPYNVSAIVCRLPST